MTNAPFIQRRVLVRRYACFAHIVGSAARLTTLLRVPTRSTVQGRGDCHARLLFMYKRHGNK